MSGHRDAIPASSEGDPGLRLGLGLAALVLAGLPVRTQTIGPVETTVFRAVNGLTDRLFAPAWMVMQAGNLGAVPAAAAVALLNRRPRLAARLTVAGLSTWTLAKVVKGIYRRPRPQRLVQDTHCRGPEQSGLGYVSGHAGIATVLGVAGYPALNTPARVAATLMVPAVALGRMYVGAHLPLDVLGGAALGLAVDAMVARAMGASAPGSSPNSPPRTAHCIVPVSN